MATLKQLVDETTNIKNDILTCHAKLKTKLMDKYIEVLDTDKLIDMINKIEEIRHLNIPNWYNPNFSNSWLTGKELSVGRISFGVAVVGSKLYCIGGYDGNNHSNENECYDSNKNIWVTKAPMPVKLMGHKAVSVKNKIYVMGGDEPDVDYTTNNLCYDTIKDTWERKTNLITGRRDFAMNAVGDKIYCISGYIGGANTSTEKTECYDTITDTWTTKAPITYSRHSLCSSVVNNKIYCIGGGLPAAASNQCYDTITDTWTLKKTGVARYDLTSQAIGDKIYCIGGNNGNSDLKTNMCYDTITDTWTTKKSMPTSRASLCSGRVGNMIYCIGGHPRGESMYYGVNEVYIP